MKKIIFKIIKKSFNNFNKVMNIYLSLKFLIRLDFFIN